jgi:tetratricopeptide (TPR) repeat protein
LEAGSQEGLLELVAAAGADGIELIVRSEMPETDILAYEDTRIVRLFRNYREYRYTMPIHEQIRSSIEESGGVIIPSDLMITHHGYSKGAVQGKENRAERNLKILRDALSDSPDNPYLHYQLGVTLMSTGEKTEAYEELKKVLVLDYAGMGPAVLERLFMKLSQLALEKNENEAAIGYAGKSLEYNPYNSISMYVVAIGLLSMNRVAEGYEMLLKIRGNPGSNLRLDIQLEHLIKACRELLKI